MNVIQDFIRELSNTARIQKKWPKTPVNKLTNIIDIFSSAINQTFPEKEFKTQQELRELLSTNYLSFADAINKQASWDLYKKDTMQQIGDLLEILQTPPSKYENEKDSAEYWVKKAFKIPKEVNLKDELLKGVLGSEYKN